MDKLATGTAAILALMLCACGIGNDQPRDDFPAFTSQQPAAELPGIPTISELPPVIPQTGPRASSAQATGPRKAHVAWGVALPFAQPTILQAIGADGTIYVSGYDGVGAVSKGVLLWAYRAHNPRVTMADDGRIWFPAPETVGFFCLNQAGKGGMLPQSIQPPPDAADPPMVGCSGNGRAMRVQGRQSAVLDYECTRSQAKLGPDGTAYVGTLAPDIRAISPDGTVAWKVSTPCAAQRLLAGPGGRVFFACQDNSLHLIENGAVKWSKSGDGEIDEGNVIRPSSSFVGWMDRDGVTYFVDRTTNGFETHVHAMNAAGDLLWTLQTPLFNASSIAVDGQGRIYLTGTRGAGSQLVCISD